MILEFHLDIVSVFHDEYYVTSSESVVVSVQAQSSAAATGNMGPWSVLSEGFVRNFLPAGSE